MIGWLLACDGDPGETGTKPLPTDSATDTQVDCTALEAGGQTWDCSRVDYCDPAQAVGIDACCACNPGYCSLPDDCPDPEPTGATGETGSFEAGETCMACHNGSLTDDYLGAGLPDPHPFGAVVTCTSCHGGDPTRLDPYQAHVPRPPEIGDDGNLAADPAAYFAYLTRTGVDRLPDYTFDGTAYTALDYLQFLNPGDSRVAVAGRGCGQNGCHLERAQGFAGSLHGTNAGVFSSAAFSVGLPAEQAGHQGLYADTAGDLAFRAGADPTWVYDPAEVGRVGERVELAETAVAGDPFGLSGNPDALAGLVAGQRDAEGRVVPGSALDQVVRAAISFQCGDCHAGSSGPNQGTGVFRGGGCAACHFAYGPDGRTGTNDPNLPVDEPADPEALVAPERPHVLDHRIRSSARTVTTPAGDVFVPGVSDATCATCHRGTNHTVLQYWGVRVDPAGDVAGGTQYPAGPVSWTGGAADPRLSGGATWAGIPVDQLLVDEDYDGDLRDDTPPDVHAEAGMGCVDCHGSRDVHGDLTWDDGSGGQVTDPTSGHLWSRMDQAVGVTCEGCHGTAEAARPTTTCIDPLGAPAVCATDRFGNPLRHVTVDANGDTWLRGRLDGLLHYVLQVRDSVVDSGAVHPIDGQPLYEPLASFAMGRADADPANGTGPVQQNPALYAVGFSHLDRMSCTSCHAAWTNTCVGCHLELTADEVTPAFGRITGERLGARVTTAAPTYATPVWSALAVDPSGRVGLGQPSTATFWTFRDREGALSPVIVPVDRNGEGDGPDNPALGHGGFAAHSIRAEPTADREGSRQCVACHLDQDQLATYGTEYAAFVSAVTERRYADLDWALLRQHLGQNPGNQLGSPLYVWMNAGLGTGMFLTDAAGCPVNPLDAVVRPGCAASPADGFGAAVARYDLDRAVSLGGEENTSQPRPARDPAASAVLRSGARWPELAGPLGAGLPERLASPDTPLVLDTWVDADGVQHP